MFLYLLTQRESGYFKAHGLKAQIVFLPNGMIGSAYIESLRHNDNGILNMSGLSDYIHNLIGHIRLPVHGLCPYLYTDAIYQLTPNITPRMRNPTNDNGIRMNIRMSGLREYVEHLFADFKTLFAIYNQPFRNLMLNNGHHFRRMLMVSFFVLNFYYCIHGTHGRNFNIFPVSLEQYLPLNEVLTFAT